MYLARNERGADHLRRLQEHFLPANEIDLMNPHLIASKRLRAKWIRSTCQFLAAGLCYATPNFSTAGEVMINGAIGHVTGILLAKDIESLDNSELEKIVFENSPGGSVEAVNAYVEFIRRRKLQTEVKGKCHSACAVSFLAGTKRTTDKSTINSIFFHLARVLENGKTRPANNNGAMMILIDELTDGKMKEPVRSKIMRSWQENSGVVFLIGPGIFGERTNTLYCDGTQGMDTSKCAFLLFADPYDMGVLTRK